MAGKEKKCLCNQAVKSYTPKSRNRYLSDMVYGQLCERALYGRTHNPEFRLEKISPDREKDFVSKGIDLRIRISVSLRRME